MMGTNRRHTCALLDLPRRRHVPQGEERLGQPKHRRVASISDAGRSSGRHTSSQICCCDLARSSSPWSEKLVATAPNSGCLVPFAVLSLQQLHGRQEELT